jgi:prolyl 4-hydroxylase
MIQNPYRTSWSAGLEPEDPAVHCVLGRSKKFLGTFLDPVEDEMGVPQLVRYNKGQKYNLHHDWLREPQAAFDGSPRSFNRVASFFVILQDNCTGGETWFPFIKAISPQPREMDQGRLWHEHEDGGIAFKPAAGNGIFWVNLFANGTGDTRTVHAGLPLSGGLKTAMNIWPRQYHYNSQ